MKNKIHLLLMTLVVLALPVAAMAGDAGDDIANANDAEAARAQAAQQPVIIPYDVTKPLDAQKPDRVYIGREQFLQLWEQAKANKRGPQPEKMDVPFLLSSGRYDATLDDHALHVTGVIDLQTFNDAWVNVPLEFKGVNLGTLKLDGQSALMTKDGVAIEKPGHHSIEVGFDIPLGADRTRLAWGIPETAGTLLSITLPAKQMKATVQPGEGVVERINGEQKIVTVALGATNHVDLQLDSSVGLSTMKQAAVAKIDTALSITPAVELAHTGFEFSFPESQQDHFTVVLDKALSLVKLDVQNLKSWKLTEGNDNQTLDITLAEPVQGSFKFFIDTERTLADAQRHFPFISALANRIERTSALFSTPFLNITPQPGTALRQVDYPADQGNGLRLVAAFEGTGDRDLLAYDVQPAKLSNSARISYVYLVNHTKIELVAALKLQAKNATVFDATVGLPGDFTVEAVESGRLKDWWREGDTLHVRFKGNAPGFETPLVLHLVKLYPTTTDAALEITPLTLPAGWDVSGNGIIAANASVQPDMTLTGAKEINPQNAATDFRILPPMERKRGFSFTSQDFHASVKLATLPPRIDGTWVMSAQVHENWVSVSTHVNLSARQGSAPGISFRLPAETPEARITGENVRETTSAVDGKWRVYHVAFQNDLVDKTDFALDFDLPGNGNVSLRAFEFVGVERGDGFVIVDNASQYQMEVAPSGLEVALSEQIPFLPSVSRNASLYHAQPGWALQIKLTRLEKEAGRAVYVEWAELTTAIRADGSEWHRATYHLLNRSLQFLPVKLPDGAELASVTVAGESVRADRGQAAGKDVLLVPLIKTKPGDDSYNVDLVYRNARPRSMWTFSRETLADPEVVGISVEKTFWNVAVPQGTGAGSFGGNMEQVLLEVNETEKQQANLEELKNLGDIASNSADAEVRANAEQNYKAKAEMMQKSLAPAPAKSVNATLEFKKQSDEVDAQREELNRDLQAQLAENARSQQMQQQQNQPLQAQSANPAAFGVTVTGTVSVLQNRAVTQSWAANGSYVSKEPDTADKSKEIDQQNAQPGNQQQLYVNDYVVNLQDAGANTYAGATTVNSGEVAAGNNGYNNGGTVIAAGGNVINGNVTLGGNSTVTLNSANTLNGGAGSGTLVQGKVSEIQEQQKKLREKGGGKPAAATAPSSLTTRSVNGASSDVLSTIQSESNSTGNVTVLSSARANPAFNPASVEREIQQANPRGGGEGYADMPRVQPPAPVAVALPVDANPGAMDDAATYYSRGILQGPQGQAQLQTAGAISLPIDFPIDGLRMYHFKKLNTNARLSFWITNERSLDNWKWFAVFAVVALLIKGVFKFAGRGSFRVLKRRVVHI
ncbi:MAG TPA: hypothetical protein VG733_00545 [Chthoniobacteraceae bacterium]|nr:hypothetical protein [Chthoniobacteraceae bacterium]